MSLLTWFMGRARRGGYSISLTAIAICTVATATAVSLSGCGSSDNDPAYALPSTTVYAANTYRSHVTLRDGRTGTLDLNVQSDNSVRGVFTVDGMATRAIAINTPFISGTFDPNTGAIVLAGSYVVNGETFTLNIQGILPVPPSQSGGQLTWKIDGASYSSSWTITIPAVSPTPGVSPSPGISPSPGTSPTPTSSPTTGVGGSGSVFFITPSGVTAAVDTSDIRVSGKTGTPGSPSGVSGAYSSGAGSVIVYANDGTQTRTITIAFTRTGGTTDTGDYEIFDVAAGHLPGDRFAIVQFFDAPNNLTAAQTGLYYKATSGKITVEAVSVDRIKLYFENVRMGADTTAFDHGQTGTFGLSGEVEVQLR